MNILTFPLSHLPNKDVVEYEVEIVDIQSMNEVESLGELIRCMRELEKNRSENIHLKYAPDKVKEALANGVRTPY